jgi:hypothetical protein
VEIEARLSDGGMELAPDGFVTLFAPRRAAAATTTDTPGGVGREREHKMDAFYIGLTVILIASTLGLIRLCERV